jgi:hypothetical protein
MKRFWILLAVFAFALPAFAADVTLQWSEPSTNVGGSALTNLAFTNGYCQPGTGTVLKSANVPASKPAGGSTVSTVITVPTPAGVSTTVVCWVTATNSASPAQTSANSATASKTYTPPLPTYTLSGSLSAAGGGATVTLTGPANATVTADATGAYSFPTLANGTYTVTPSKPGFSFSPASQSVRVNNANPPAADFTAAPLVPNAPSNITIQ